MSERKFLKKSVIGAVLALNLFNAFSGAQDGYSAISTSDLKAFSTTDKIIGAVVFPAVVGLIRGFEWHSAFTTPVRSTTIHPESLNQTIANATAKGIKAQFGENSSVTKSAGVVFTITGVAQTVIGFPGSYVGALAGIAHGLTEQKPSPR